MREFLSQKIQGQCNVVNPIRQKTNKLHLCALMSHICALSPNSVTLKCAIHYLPKESEFGRPKNKWNILDIICPKFFWSHIFISFCFFSWLFQIPSSWCLSRKKVRKKVFNWSEFHLYQSSFLQNPYFSKKQFYQIDLSQ